MNALRAAALSTASALFALAPHAAMAAASCESLAQQSFPDAKVDMAVTVPAGDLTLPGGRGGQQAFRNLPAFCRVAATLKPTTDSDIKIELWLPQNWNGKFQGVGNGGWAGTISYDSLADGIRSGYATVSTDTGHKGANGDFVPGHWEKLLDFAWRSQHEMTLKGKALTAAYYGSAPKLSYWNGCSTGGRQGLMEATRFPNEYDAMVLGDPANPRSIHDAWAITVIQKIHADKSEAGALTRDHLALLHRAVINACDAVDGVKDGVVENPKVCKFDVKTVACKPGQTANCLTDAQVRSAEIVYSPYIAHGKAVHPGLTLTSEWGWQGITPPGAEPRGADNFRVVVYKDPEWDWRKFNADTGYDAAVKADQIESVLSTDLSAFTAHGGKAIFYHGWADQQVSAQGTIDYFADLQKNTRNAPDATRLFMVPGMGHCGGGVDGATDQFDAVAALDAWVTTGKPPEKILAAAEKDGKPVRTRPLCPYPQQAHYSGTGSTDEAASFVCKAP
jgi:feruloyl esterase